MTFVSNVPPKFRCDHCKNSIYSDDECIFFRRYHFHPNCMAKGAEAVKAGDYQIPEIKPVNLSKDS